MVRLKEAIAEGLASGVATEGAFARVRERAGLPGSGLMQEEIDNQEKLLRLKSAIAEGLASGVAGDGDAVFTRLEQRIRDREAAKEESPDLSQP